MKTKGVEIHIESDDQPLPEYDTQEADGVTSTFIPSEAGKQFKISYINGSGSPLAVDIFCDGELLDQWLFEPEAEIGGIIIGPYNDETTDRVLFFSHLQLTDDDQALESNHARSLKDLGTIKITICRCEVLGKLDEYTPLAVTLEQEPLHEKTKRAGEHAITLGEPADKGFITSSWQTTLVDPQDSPYIQFMWRYRPKAMLQAQGIIPLDTPRASPAARPRSPSSSSSASPPAKRQRREERTTPQAGSSRVDVKPEIHDDELEALLAERETIEARIREAEGRRVKREPSPIQLVKCEAGEVVDLTLG